MATHGERPAFVLPVRVYYEDTDCAGIVYHANYLRFMERARTEWLRSLGFDQGALRDGHSVQFVVSRVNVEFTRPARYDDVVDVGVILRRARRASLELSQPVHRAGELLCHAEVRIGCVGTEGLRPRPIPSPIARELQRDR